MLIGVKAVLKVGILIEGCTQTNVCVCQISTGNIFDKCDVEGNCILQQRQAL